MKKSYLPIALISLVAVSFATNVTFRLNMSTYSGGATDSTSTVHVRGSFNDWSDANPLTNDGGDYWSATIDIAAGDIEYKFTHTDDLDALTWESISNRTYTVPSTDVVLDIAYWDDVAPFTPTDSLDVYFRVNMAGVIGYAGEQVDVRGTFNNWSAGNDLTREGTDSDFWSGVISIPQTSDLFFSEYIEGSSSNKVLEIFNGTGSAIDLSNYLILQNSNGGPMNEYVDQLSGTLETGDVYVIANANADATILSQADLTGSGICYFNGNDARALAKIVTDGTETDTIVYDIDNDGTDDTFYVVILDYIGTFPDDPGTGWDVAGTTEATKDHTLVRKSSVTSGNSDWSSSAGTTSDDSEWIVKDKDTFSYLGSHSVSPAIEYKFTYYDATTTTWESISNRTATINQDTTLAWKWFNDEPYSAEIDTFSVKFICNTATMDNITDSTVAGFYVSGDFNGWSQADSLTAAGDYWSKTIDIVGSSSGTDVNYKFRYTDLAGLEFWEGDPNRTATISSDTTLFHWWDRAAPFTPTDSIDVWFRVNMAGVVDFDGTSPVGVRGSLPHDPTWYSSFELTQEGDSDYYSGLISFNNDSAGNTIEYKFVWGALEGWDNVHWEEPLSTGGGNRSFVLSADTTLAFKYFGDVPPAEEEPVTASVYWTVDMTSYTLMDLFSPARDDTMQVRGGFNGWSSTALPDGSNINATNIPGTYIYELSVPLTMYPETEDAYKYYIQLSSQSLDLIQTQNPYFFADMGYENPPTMGGGNRFYTFEGDPDQTQVLGLEYYNDIPPEALIPYGQTIDLTFNVDMSSAADLGFDAATDTVWFIFQDHWAEHVQGFSIAENSHHPDLILTDPDGDNIYSVTFPVTGYTPGSMVYTYEFGDATGGYFQEGGGFAYGRYRCRYIQQTNGVWPSAYEFPQDAWTTDPPLVVEDPPDYISVDDEIKLPKEFTVSQNFPNPFNPTTEIKFTLPEADMVTFTIYNVLGQKVVKYNRKFDHPGTYGLRWNGTDQQGIPVSSGVYLYEIRTSKHHVTKKMTLLR